MNENVNDSSTQMDDQSSTGPTEQELLDAVMSNSPIMDEIDVPLPEEDDPDQDSVEIEEDEDEPTSEEAEIEEDDDEVETEEEETEGGDDTSTEPEVYSLDDLDEFQVSVKIDGEETSVSIQDLVKGYATEQSLSNKGRELGEARKQLEEERAAKLSQLDEMGSAAANLLQAQETAHAKSYHDIEAQIEKARADGDTYEVNELKDKREQVQKHYWEARNKREGLVKATAEQKQQAEQEQFQEQIQNFQEVIPTMIPDFDEKVATSIRDFALERGIAEELLNGIVDPNVVKFIDDFRRLEQGVSKGAAKRKAAPAKKAVPTKKAKPAAKKKADQENMVKARAFKDGATQDDQMAFLRNYASKSLGN